MTPSQEFPYRSNIYGSESCPIFSEIILDITLKDKYSALRWDRFPIDVGREPKNEFSERPRYSKYNKFPKESGKSPPSLFEAKSKVSRVLTLHAEKAFVSSFISPVIWLYEISKECKLHRFPCGIFTTRNLDSFKGTLLNNHWGTRELQESIASNIKSC